MTWILAGIYAGGATSAVIVVLLWLVWREPASRLRTAFIGMGAACLGYAFFGGAGDILVFMSSPFARTVQGVYGISGMACGVMAVALLDSFPPASPRWVGRQGLAMIGALSGVLCPLYFTDYWISHAYVFRDSVQAERGIFYFAETAWILVLGASGVALLVWKNAHSSREYEKLWNKRLAITTGACIAGLIVLTLVLPAFSLDQFAVTIATTLPAVAMIAAYQAAFGEHQKAVAAEFGEERSWNDSWLAFRRHAFGTWRVLLNPREDISSTLIERELGARFWWLTYLVCCAMGGIGIAIYFYSGGSAYFNGWYLFLQPIFIALTGNLVILTANQICFRLTAIAPDVASRQLLGRAMVIVCGSSMLLSVFYFLRLVAPIPLGNPFLTLSGIPMAYVGIRVLPSVMRHVAPWKTLTAFGLVVVIQMGLFIVADSLSGSIVRFARL